MHKSDVSIVDLEDVDVDCIRQILRHIFSSSANPSEFVMVTEGNFTVTKPKLFTESFHNQLRLAISFWEKGDF